MQEEEGGAEEEAAQANAPAQESGAAKAGLGKRGRGDGEAEEDGEGKARKRRAGEGEGRGATVEDLVRVLGRAGRPLTRDELVPELGLDMSRRDHQETFKVGGRERVGVC